LKFEKNFFLNFGPFLVFDPAVAHLPSPPRRPTGQPTQWPSASPPSLPLSSLIDVRARLVVFLHGPTAAAAVSRERTAPPGAASAPVTAGAPTLQHSPPPPRPIPFRNGRLHSIMAHHRRRPFPSDARPPRSPSDPIKRRGAHLSSPH
jgi:hypothetical protein